MSDKSSWSPPVPALAELIDQHLESILNKRLPHSLVHFASMCERFMGLGRGKASRSLCLHELSIHSFGMEKTAILLTILVFYDRKPFKKWQKKKKKNGRKAAFFPRHPTHKDPVQKVGKEHCHHYLNLTIFRGAYTSDGIASKFHCNLNTGLFYIFPDYSTCRMTSKS